MNVEAAFDEIHEKIARNILFQKFSDFTRVVLAVGFFAPGLHKLMGLRFTTIPVDNPIGAFFEALFQTGFYYRFIGAAQILAAVLVLFRRTATLGSLMFFGITLNVFIITISIPFGTGTPIVTGLMLLASIYLICWDYQKLKPILPFFSIDSSDKTIFAKCAEHPSNIASKLGYWIFAVAGIVLMCELRGLLPELFGIRRIAFLTSAIGAILMISGFVIEVLNKHKISSFKSQSV